MSNSSFKTLKEYTSYNLNHKNCLNVFTYINIPGFLAFNTTGESGTDKPLYLISTLWVVANSG